MGATPHPRQHWAGRASALACLATVETALALAPPAPTPEQAHAAQCAAALEASAEVLARQVRTGKKELRASVQENLQGSLAFFASAYVDGGAAERRARQLAAQARSAQAKMPPAELSALQGSCFDEGRQRFIGADGLTRAVLSRHADLRLEKLLGK